MTSSTDSCGDIEIRIEALRPTGYPVKLFSDDQVFPGYSSASTPNLGMDSAEDDGQLLFDWLFDDPKLRDGWMHLEEQFPDCRTVRLWIDDEAPELHQLPWELLYDGYSTLAASRETPFSRFLTSSRVAPRPALRPVNVLVAIAAPEGLEKWDLVPIDVAEELDNLKSVLDVPGRAEMTVLEQPCTLEALDRMLADDYHVLHFVGHGTFNETTGVSAVILADDKNQPRNVLEKDFIGVFERHMGGGTLMHDRSLRMVYLSSCLQAKRSSASAFSGIGARLVETGVPSVIAMQDLLEVRVGRQFAREFYRDLFRNGRVDAACNRARSNVMARAPYGSKRTADPSNLARRHSAVPVLFMHRKDGWLWDRAGFAGEGSEWNLVADIMKDRHYALILGPDFNRVLIGSRSEIASRWARRYGFPLTPERRRDLAQVAQFVAVKAGQAGPRAQLVNHIRDELTTLYADDVSGNGMQKEEQASVDEMIIRAGLGRQSRNEYEPYRLVANLPVSVYMTVNESSLLVASLRAAGKHPMVAFSPWNEKAKKLSEHFYGAMVENPDEGEATVEGEAAASYDTYQGERPSVERPLVYYLFGHLCDTDTLVLTEDDYFDYLIAASKDREIIHPTIRRQFNDKGLMFLGFQLEDWAFRVLFRSIMQQTGRYMLGNYRHVAAQINPQLTDIESVEDAKRYLAQYFQDQDMSVYWGSVEHFLTELVKKLPS